MSDFLASHRRDVRERGLPLRVSDLQLRYLCRSVFVGMWLVQHGTRKEFCFSGESGFTVCSPVAGQGRVHQRSFQISCPWTGLAPGAKCVHFPLSHPIH